MRVFPSRAGNLRDQWISNRTGRKACLDTPVRMDNRDSRSGSASCLLSWIAGARKIERCEQAKRVAESVVRQVVPHIASLRRGHHESAVAEARQMVREVGPRGPDFIGECSGVGGSVEKSNEDALPDRVGERGTNASKGSKIEPCCYIHR